MNIEDKLANLDQNEINCKRFIEVEELSPPYINYLCEIGDCEKSGGFFVPSAMGEGTYFCREHLLNYLDGITELVEEKRALVRQGKL